AGELAQQLTLERSTAAVAAGASERSRAMRAELRGGLSGMELDRADELLDRLLQVRVEDYDGRSGWRRFDDLRRTLRRARSLGERRRAAELLVEAGLELFGSPIDDEVVAERIEVTPDEIRLVAYEALVAGEVRPARIESADRLFEQEGDQLAM